MSGRISQRGDTSVEGSLTPNEKILRDVHQLYVDEENGKYPLRPGHSSHFIHLFSTTYAIVLFFSSRPFHENFKFLKNCPYDSHEILHSHSTPKGAAACAKASKSYGWDVRNIAKISPKMAKKSHFSIFSQTLHTIRTKASQKEKDLSRLLYRICGSDFVYTLLFFLKGTVRSETME